MAKTKSKNGLIWSGIVVVAGVVGFYEHLPYALAVLVVGLVGVALYK